MANTYRKWQETGDLAKAFPWPLVSQNIFADIWPGDLRGRYIQSKSGAAAEWNENPRRSLMIYSSFISRTTDTTTVQSIKMHIHISAQGWPHNPRKAPSQHDHQIPDWPNCTLNTQRQVCVARVWESLLLWPQWWEITDTTGLMYSFHGQAFFSHMSHLVNNPLCGVAVQPTAHPECRRDYHGDIAGGFRSGHCDISGIIHDVW